MAMTPEGVMPVWTVYDDARELFTPEGLANLNLCTSCTPGLAVMDLNVARATGLIKGNDGHDRVMQLVHDDDCPDIGVPMLPNGPVELFNGRPVGYPKDRLN